VIALTALFVAVLGVAVVFGTDMFFTVVGRKALAHTSAPAMLETMGRVHEVADRRMPVFGIIGIVGGLLALALAPTSRAAACTALGAQLLWLAVYLKVNKPLNARMTEAARAGISSSEGRRWQKRWESALIPRSLLMAIALVALLLAIVNAH
jgi:NAD(P)H-hydrate repair Nnr-like enzyme with NAD(P)H-hydrate dehydratase domain